MAILNRARARAVLGALVVATQASARSASLTEARVKAGMLCNLAAFVEWPVEAPPRASVVVIGVVGPDPVYDALVRVRGQIVNGRAVEPRLIDGDADPRQCHILFIPQSPQRMADGVLPRVQGAPVLTVGEDDDFTRQGGVIRFYVPDGHVRFEVNLTAAERADLRISSKVLSLARLVRGGRVTKD